VADVRRFPQSSRFEHFAREKLEEALEEFGLGYVFLGEEKMAKTEASRAKKILAILEKAYPDARIMLNFKNPLELLIATILAAQCTDERVNQVTPILFRKYRSARDFAKADPGELEAIIRPTGFFHAKARAIINCCQRLVQTFGGKVPETMEELTTLPGVGRKTANVVRGNAFRASSAGPSASRPISTP